LQEVQLVAEISQVLQLLLQTVQTLPFINYPEEQVHVEPLKDIPAGQLKQLLADVMQVRQLALQAVHSDPFK
jgi:hypothetical protein